ncbi:MAG TPA: hypothetical protein VK879_22715 [Candidatus Sulfomarinibacteraceae bacterium]|nr:hypothetical protein [Candidatus Sulfomarinibacteraceae bacterium]
MPDHQQQSEAQKILERARRLLSEPESRPQAEARNGRQTDQKGIAILFAHIRAPGLQRSAQMSAGNTALSEYKEVALRQVAAHGGHLLAEASDTVLALFTAGHDKSPVKASVDTATSIMERVAVMNKQRLAQDLVPFRIGIGIDSGTVQTGRGLEPATTDSALERHVRMARGLSDLNQQTPFPAIFISENMAHSLNEYNGFHIQNLGDVFLNKRQHPITVYALLHSNQGRPA